MKIDFVNKTGGDVKKGRMQSWVKEGYSIFSKEGPASIQVERLARNLKKNKSGFYYFYKDRESFLDGLMQEHLDRLNSLTFQIREVRQFEPEYLNLLTEHREVLFFQIQLVKNRETELFNRTLSQFNSRITTAILPVWSDYVEASMEISEKLWGMTRDSMYCRATQDNFDYDWFVDLVSNAKLIANYQNSQTEVY